MNLSTVDKATDKLEKVYIAELNKSYQVALNDIKTRISKIYERYSVDGKLDMATMQKMAVKDQKELTRLQKLFSNIDEDLNALNRGRPQQLSGHLTSVYETNNLGVVSKISDITEIDDKAFKVIDRQAVYNSATSELGKIGLQSNAQAIKTNIQRSITTSIVQGESITKMGKRIKSDLETNANNAIRIARTETTRVMGEAREDVFSQAQDLGIELKKKWVSADDSRTRSSHKHLDNEVVDNDKPFSNGLMYPGDPSGPASEVINCRCTMSAVLTDYDDEIEIKEKTEEEKLEEKAKKERQKEIQKIEEKINLGVDESKAKLKNDEGYHIVKDYKNGGYKFSDNKRSASSLTENEKNEAINFFKKQNISLIEEYEPLPSHIIRNLEEELDALKKGFNSKHAYIEFLENKKIIEVNELEEIIKKGYIYNQKGNFINNYGTYGISYDEKKVISQIKKEIEELGFKEYYKSNSGSLYFEKGDVKIRLTDHYLPDTAERSANYILHGESFKNEIIITQKEPSNLQEIVKLGSKDEVQK